MLADSLVHDAVRFAGSLVNREEFNRLQDLRRQVTPEGYTLKDFDRTQSIFLHIPKTGGVSVSRALYGNLAASHKTIEQYQLAFSARDFNRYFKFCFVRNPWDRLYSAYRFLRKGGIDATDREWAAKNLTSFSDFEQFVTVWLSRENAQSSIHFRPQHEFMLGRFSNRVHVDFIGRFENLATHFAYVARRIGVNANLPHLHRTSSGASYRDVYTNRMARRVGDVYREDIRRLDYAFQ